MDRLGHLAVVVPVGPGDRAWTGLLPQLEALPPAAEVVLAGAEAAPATLPPRVRWLHAPRGRARQLNAGAGETRNRFLWFLHADSCLEPDTLRALDRALAVAPDALHYFDLAFLDDGPSLMWLNQAGAWARSRWGGMPFGDQGFCMRRDVFHRLGGFRTDAAYGEDHLLAWKARQLGVPLRSTGARLRTSARRYRERGWLATTVRHIHLTARQALPEWLKLIRG